MVGNMTFGEMVQTLDHYEDGNNDYLVPTSTLKMDMDDRLVFSDKSYTMRDVAHTQVANKLKIPNNFYDRMGSYPGLRTDVVNRLMEKQEKPMFVRTHDTELRAVLSDRYKPISNLDVLNAASPVLRDMDIAIKSSSLTEKRMYLQVAFPKMEGEIVAGDVVQYGLTITNSEVGYGMVKVSPTIWRLVCSNGMVRAAEINHRHIGKQMEMGEDYTILSDQAKIADKMAFQLKLRDTIQASVNEASFDSWLGQMKDAAGLKVNNLVKTVTNITKHFGISDTLNDLVVNNVANEGKITKWGVVNGITAIAHHTESRDLMFEVEKAGAALIDMSYAQWSRLAA